MNENKKIADYMFELGMLKRFKRTGWWLAKVKDPEDIADHVYRSSMLSLILGKREGADADRCMKMNLVHDNQEARTLDLNKVTQRYIDNKEGEMNAFKEQVNELPDEMKDEFISLFEEFEEQKTKESIISRDADLLECAITAKEYLEVGYKDCQDWIDNCEKLLKTKSAKNILEEVKKGNTNEWYFKLKKIKR